MEPETIIRENILLEREKAINKVKNLHSLRSFGRAENARPFGGR